MSEIYHRFGQALQLDANGGLLMVAGTEQGREKIVRRLLTNTGDLLGNINYGAGVNQYIGSTIDPLQIQASIKSQMKAETIVQQSPAPRVGLTEDLATGLVMATITYVDNTTLEQSTARIPISN